MGTLSSGQTQRVLFARMLVQDAQLILLDEPFNAMDSKTTQALLALIHQWHRQQRTVVTVLHDDAQVRQHFPHTLLLAREVVAIVKRQGWTVDVFGIPAIEHMTPARIAPAVERKFLAIRDRYDRVLVVYGDCGTRGALDAFLARHDLDWRDDVQGIIVRDGDLLKVGDLEVRIMETPGHSSCSISAYIPELKTLLPSDAGGIPIDDAIFTSANSNYTLYQESLERLKDLEVEYFGADHHGYIVGPEARDYVLQSIAAARKLRTRIETVYRETGDIDRASRLLTEELYTRHPNYFLAPEIIVGVFGQMVKHIAKAMNG